MNAPDTTEGQGYLRWFYENNIWKNMSWRGVRTLKLPSDMWSYQEIISQHDIHWIFETGTRHGGSALFFSDILIAKQASGFVVTADISHEDLDPQVMRQPGIRFIRGDSGSTEIAMKMLEMRPENSAGRALLILDSDHRQDHVYRELCSFVPRLRKGDYLIVEDGIVNGHPVRPDFGPGPYEAIEKFKKNNPDSLEQDVEREKKFGCTFAVNGYYLRT